MSNQMVKLCGKRGMVIWCLACDDWQPFTSNNDTLAGKPFGVCRTCQTSVPEIPSASRRRVSSPQADKAEGDHTNPLAVDESGSGETVLQRLCRVQQNLARGCGCGPQCPHGRIDDDLRNSFPLLLDLAAIVADQVAAGGDITVELYGALKALQRMP